MYCACTVLALCNEITKNTPQIISAGCSKGGDDMPVYKDEYGRKTWYCKIRYTDWTGTVRNHKKRGFLKKSDSLFSIKADIMNARYAVAEK